MTKSAEFNYTQMASLRKAAAEDLYMLDLSVVSPRCANDNAHYMIGETLKMARKRFEAHLQNIPASMMNAAIEMIGVLADEMCEMRLEKCLRTAKHLRRNEWWRRHYAKRERHAVNEVETDMLIATA